MGDTIPKYSDVHDKEAMEVNNWRGETRRKV